MKYALPILSLIVFLAACSGTPPEFVGHDWMVVYTYDQSRGGIYTELDFFLQLKDDDGLDDISEIKISKDDQGWFWLLTPENWISYSKDDEDWIGSSGLTRGGDLPRGEYRVSVGDRSGQKSEITFALDETGPVPRIHEFPRAQVSSDFIRLDAGKASPVVLWFYNDKGDLVSEVYKKGGLYRKSELLKPEELQIATWFMIYHQNEEGGYGLKSGPYLMYEPEPEN